MAVGEGIVKYTIAKTHLRDTQSDIETDRHTYVGCSDIGTIMGVNPWKSAYTLWAEKTGKLPVEDISDKPAVWWGHQEEELVAKWFTKETGIRVQRSNYRYYIKEMPYFSGHIDRLLLDRTAGLEIKTTSVRNKTAYAEGDIPDSHYWQCMGYMALTGLDTWYIATKQDQTVYISKIQRNEEDIEKLLDAVQNFWKCVTDGIPPQTDGTESTTDTLERIFTPTRPDKIYLSDDTDTVLAALAEKEAQMKVLKKEIEALKNDIKSEMGESELAESEGYIVTWKSYASERFDSKRFKEEHPDTYKRYITYTEGRRFTLKERNKK